MRAALSAGAPVEPDDLFGAAVELPPDALSPLIVPAGDSHWLAASDDYELHGLGVAARFANGHQFRQACGRWRQRGQGSSGLPPVAFFTAPPDFPAAEPTLWVPRVLLRRQRGRLTLWLAARRGDAAPHLVARQWRAEAEALLTGRRQSVVPPKLLSARTTPSADEWGERVGAARRAIADGQLTKVVLARRLEGRLSRPVDASAVAARLTRDHPGCCVFAVPQGTGVVVGASPERVAAVRDGHVVSHALAGTAARGQTPMEDRRAAARLLASAKERREHAVVVDFIARQMEAACNRVERSPEPTVMRLRRVQHLWTPISGTLRPGIGLLDVAALLHPTPAVLGQPRQDAGEWLKRVGERRDGLYTGLVGWVDGFGDGDAAVVLRSAHVDGTTAVLWAGAGIMADSDPAAELAETDLKLATMLDALEYR